MQLNVDLDVPSERVTQSHTQNDFWLNSEWLTHGKDKQKILNSFFLKKQRAS